MTAIKNTLFSFFLLIISGQILGQGIWQVTTLSDMPEPVSNNAISTDGNFVYSFMGIDSTKIYSGIHLKGFKYDIAANTWDSIPSVPDNLTRIAASASVVNGKIYVLGGYHVPSTGPEVSSNGVFIYDPATNSYTSGTNIPIATDDHVQCVWNDSLIYVISGWSNTANILAVQIYNPALDTWTTGTSLPGGGDYESFGASGVIIDNTIYYAGGADDVWVFSMIPKIRIGVIDPLNPDFITWSISDDTLANLYRSGSGELDGKPIWFGGADKSYNYNGIEYGTGIGVEPLNRVTAYDPQTTTFSVEDGSITGIMDMRGIAQIDSNKYIIAGGMGPGQEVSNKTYLLEYVIPPGVEQLDELIQIATYPNPVSNILEIGLPENQVIRRWFISDLTGRIAIAGETLSDKKVNVSHLENGLYSLSLITKNGVLSTSFLVSR